MHFQNKKTDASLRKTITPPRLMRLHTANQIKSRIDNISNFSGTGFGTLSSEPIFYAKYDENKCLYQVLNYDKFSQEDSPTLLQIL
jgi:hypothetical protein